MSCQLSEFLDLFVPRIAYCTTGVGLCLNNSLTPAPASSTPTTRASVRTQASETRTIRVRVTRQHARPKASIMKASCPERGIAKGRARAVHNSPAVGKPCLETCPHMLGQHLRGSQREAEARETDRPRGASRGHGCGRTGWHKHMHVAPWRSSPHQERERIILLGPLQERANAGGSRTGGGLWWIRPQTGLTCASSLRGGPPAFDGAQWRPEGSRAAQP